MARSWTAGLGLLAVCLFSLGALVGCGDSAPLDDARWHVDAGRLERADELLAGYDSPAVDRLRADIERRLEARADALAELAALRASRDDRPSADVIEDLRAAVAAAEDPVVKERAEIELSRAYDWVTERGAGPSRSSGSGSATDRPARRRYASADAETSTDPGRSAAADTSELATGRALEPIVGAALAAYEEHVDRRDWRAALVLAESWSTDPEVSAEARARFADLHDQALASAIEEADELVVQAFRLQQDERARDARQLLAAALERFPQEGRAGSVARTLWRLEGRDGPATDDPAGGTTTVADASTAGSSADQRGADERAAGDDAPGVDGAGPTTAGAGSDDTAKNDDTAKGTDGSMADSDAPARPVRPGSSAPGDARSGDPGAQDRRGQGPRGPGSPRQGTPSEDPPSPPEVAGAPRPGGNTGRAPSKPATVEPDESRTRLIAVGERLVAGQLPELRDAAFVELLAEADHSPVAREVLEKALRDRWESALKHIERGGVLRRLARVASQREQLDDVRSHARALIFDEERYFYPYRTPHVTPSKAATYPEVQREVERRVEAVVDVWDAATSVKLSKHNREGLAELFWLRRHEGLVEGGFELPEDVPSWIEGLPHDADAVDLTNFAWTRAEAVKLARDRAVRSRNEALWSRFDKLREPAGGQSASSAPERAERDQVRITNAYRAMMGSPALAWNAELQVAAGSHSKYMSDTGEFGHFESPAATRTPFDRMRRAGYACGVSENCHKGSGDPEGAHGGWVRSSGHHRNLLRPDHKEMASAVSGGYWTQNFGHDTAFQAELDLSEWLD